MSNFWTKLKKPFFCLSPMDQVTDCAFREMFARYGKPDVLFTEFVNVDGLLHPDGRKRLLRDLKFTEKQRPIVAQVWGTDPEKFYKAARIIKELKFDGLDINMGCPQSKEIALGAGAALILNPKLALKIIRSAKKGAGKMPVSIKTRIGFDKNIIKDWIKVLLKAEPAAIIVHGRTKKEMSKAPANWEAIANAVKVRDKMKSKTLIVGNGDIQNYQDGIIKAKASGVDGVMIGRASFGNPWIFKLGGENPKKGFPLPTLANRLAASPFQSFGSREVNSPAVNLSYQPSIKERLKALLEHAKLFEKWYRHKKSFATLRKHFKAYASGFEGSKELRIKLMQTKNAAETAKVVKEFLKRAKAV